MESFVLKIAEHLPIYYRNEDEAQYAEYLTSSIFNLVRSEDPVLQKFSILPIHILFMLCVQYKILRIAKIFPTEFRKMASMIENHEIKRGLIDLDSPYPLGRARDKVLFQLFRIVSTPEDVIKEVCDMVNGRNELAHALGLPDADPEASAEKYMHALLRLRNSMMLLNDQVADKWDKDISDTGSDLQEYVSLHLREELLSQADAKNGKLSMYALPMGVLDIDEIDMSYQ